MKAMILNWPTINDSYPNGRQHHRVCQNVFFSILLDTDVKEIGRLNKKTAKSLLFSFSEMFNKTEIIEIHA